MSETGSKVKGPLILRGHLCTGDLLAVRAHYIDQLTSFHEALCVQQISEFLRAETCRLKAGSSVPEPGSPGSPGSPAAV